MVLQDLLVSQDLVVLRDLEERPAHQELMEDKADQDLKAREEVLDLREVEEKLGPKDNRVNKEEPEHQEVQDPEVNKVRGENLVLMAGRVRLVSVVRQELLEEMVHQVHRDLLDHQGHLVNLEEQVSLGLKVSEVFQVHLGLKELPVPEVR